MIDDVSKLTRFNGVVEDLVAHEMVRLRAYAELVSQNTRYIGKRLKYTPRLGSVYCSTSAPALVQQFLARCAAEGYDVRQSTRSGAGGTCILRVRVVGGDEGQGDKGDGRKDGTQKPNAGI